MKKIVYSVLLVLWMLMMFIFSNQNGTASDKTSGIITQPITEIFIKLTNMDEQKVESVVKIVSKIVRKTGHFTGYMIGGILAYLTFNSYRKIDKKNVKYVVLFIALYATTDEIHQYFVPR